MRSIRVPALLAGLITLVAPLGAQHPDAHAASEPSPVVRDGAAPRPDAGGITYFLAHEGFSNVATLVEDARVVVTFENTRYRDLRRALRDVAERLRPGIGEGRELVIVPTVDGVPLGTARFAADAQPGARTSLSLAAVPPELLSSPRASSSFGRVDVLVHPWYEAQFGDYGEPVRSRTGVAPELRIAIRRGLRLSAQVLFTLQDDLPTGESTIRPGLVTLGQTVRLPRNVFVHATAGAFTPDRYGADVQARAYSPGGRWFAGAELARTGIASYARGGWRRSPLEDGTVLVEAGWRDSRTGLVVQATAGAFLDDQQGMRVDVVRQFGEVDLGGFVMTSEQGRNGGALLRIPVGPRRHPAPHGFRLRTADAFRWEYRYYGYIPGGRRFRTGYYPDEVSRWLHSRSLPSQSSACEPACIGGP